MLTRLPQMLALAGLGALGGCGQAQPADNGTASAAAMKAAPADPRSDPYYTDASMNADEVLRRNDSAIAENKRIDTMMARYQAEDPAKLDRLRKTCSAAAGGLSSANWRAVDHCIETGW